MKKELTIKLIISVFLVVIGCGLLIAGFLVPPLGVIHSSILVGYGEIATFAGSLLGIEYRYRYKMYKDELGGIKDKK